MLSSTSSDLVENKENQQQQPSPSSAAKLKGASSQSSSSGILQPLRTASSNANTVNNNRVGSSNNDEGDLPIPAPIPIPTPLGGSVLLNSNRSSSGGEPQQLATGGSGHHDDNAANDAAVVASSGGGLERRVSTPSTPRVATSAAGHASNAALTIGNDGDANTYGVVDVSQLTQTQAAAVSDSDNDADDFSAAEVKPSPRPHPPPPPPHAAAASASSSIPAPPANPKGFTRQNINLAAAGGVASLQPMNDSDSDSDSDGGIDGGDVPPTAAAAAAAGVVPMSGPPFAIPNPPRVKSSIEAVRQSVRSAFDDDDSSTSDDGEGEGGGGVAHQQQDAATAAASSIAAVAGTADDGSNAVVPPPPPGVAGGGAANINSRASSSSLGGSSVMLPPPPPPPRSGGTPSSAAAVAGGNSPLVGVRPAVSASSSSSASSSMGPAEDIPTAVATAGIASSSSAPLVVPIAGGGGGGGAAAVARSSSLDSNVVAVAAVRDQQQEEVSAAAAVRVSSSGAGVSVGGIASAAAEVTQRLPSVSTVRGSATGDLVTANQSARDLAITTTAAVSGGRVSTSNNSGIAAASNSAVMGTVHSGGGADAGGLDDDIVRRSGGETPLVAKAVHSAGGGGALSTPADPPQMPPARETVGPVNDAEAANRPKDAGSGGGGAMGKGSDKENNAGDSVGSTAVGSNNAAYVPPMPPPGAQHRSAHPPRSPTFTRMAGGGGGDDFSTPRQTFGDDGDEGDDVPEGFVLSGGPAPPPGVTEKRKSSKKRSSSRRDSAAGTPREGSGEGRRGGSTSTDSTAADVDAAANADKRTITDANAKGRRDRSSSAASRGDDKKEKKKDKRSSSSRRSSTDDTTNNAASTETQHGGSAATNRRGGASDSVSTAARPPQLPPLPLHPLTSKDNKDAPSGKASRTASSSKKDKKAESNKGGSRRQSTSLLHLPPLSIAGGDGPEMVTEGPHHIDPKTPHLGANTAPSSPAGGGGGGLGAGAGGGSGKYLPGSGKQFVIDVRSCSPVTPNVNIVHPFVRVWVLNGRTGQSLAYGSDCSLDGKACGVTYPYDIRSRKCRSPKWDHEICFDIADDALDPQNDAVVFVELLDFGEYAINGGFVTEKFMRHGGLYPIGWGFYRLHQHGIPQGVAGVGHNPHKDVHLQLFSYPERRGFFENLEQIFTPSFLGHAAQNADGIGSYKSMAIGRQQQPQQASTDDPGPQQDGIPPPMIVGTQGIDVAGCLANAPLVYSVFADRRNRQIPFPVGLCLRLRAYDDGSTFIPRALAMTPYEYALEEVLQSVLIAGGGGSTNGGDVFGQERMSAHVRRRQLAGSDGGPIIAARTSKYAAMDYTRRRDERALPPSVVIHEESVSGAITAMAICPDNRLLAVATLSNFSAAINVFDMLNPSCNIVATLRGHADMIHSLNFNANGQYLASGSADKTAKVWNLTNLPVFVRSSEDEMLVCLATYSHGFSVYGTVFMSDVLVVGGYDTRLHVWSVPDAPLYSPANANEGGGGGAGDDGEVGAGRAFANFGNNHDRQSRLVQTVPHATAFIVFLKATDNNKLWSIDSTHHFVHWRADMNPDDGSFESLQIRRRLECPGATTADIRGNIAVLSCPGEQCILIVETRSFACIHRIGTGKRTSFIPAALMSDGKVAVVGTGNGRLLAWDAASSDLYTSRNGYSKVQLPFAIDLMLWGSNQLCVAASMVPNEASGSCKIAVLGRPRREAEVIYNADARAGDLVRSLFGGEVTLSRSSNTNRQQAGGGGVGLYAGPSAAYPPLGAAGSVGSYTDPLNPSAGTMPPFSPTTPRGAQLLATPMEPFTPRGAAGYGAGGAGLPPAHGGGDRKSRMDQIMAYWGGLVKGKGGSRGASPSIRPSAVGSGRTSAAATPPRSVSAGPLDISGMSQKGVGNGRRLSETGKELQDETLRPRSSSEGPAS